jgi:hypothetical protein
MYLTAIDSDETRLVNLYAVHRILKIITLFF